MSARQVRRMQALSSLPTKSSLDDSDNDGCDEPTTMMTKSSKHKSKRKQPTNPTVDEEQIPKQPAQQAKPVAVPPAPVSHVEQNTKAVTQQQNETAAYQQVVLEMAELEKKKKSKAEHRRRRAERDLEDEKLLDSMASQAQVQATESSPAGDVGGVAASPLSILATKLVEALTSCDTSKLNTRTERIRAFGIESVEDVGDGQRRVATTTQPTGNNLMPTRPPGMPLPKFRESLFATPNRHYWPNFSSLGVTMKQQHMQKAAGTSCVRSMYYLDWSDEEFQRAQDEFEDVVAAMADVNGMIERCFFKVPFHLPTLLQLHQSFTITGDAPNGQMMLDMALYTVGVLTSRFPWKESVLRRTLPWRDSKNRLVFETLRHGVQLALKRGCNKTAFNLSRALLSLDECDPCAALLSLDYLAIRAREWGSVLEWYEMGSQVWEAVYRGEQDRSQPATPIAERLAMLVFALPNVHFSAALARYLSEQADEQAAIDGRSSNNSAAASPSTADVSLSSKTNTTLPNSKEMLAKTMMLFPYATMKLVNHIDIDTHQSTAGWTLLSEMSAEYEKKHATTFPVALHITEIFVQRHAELWKTKDAMNLLLRAADFVGSHPYEGDDAFKMRVMRETFAAEPLLGQYRSTTVDDVVGEKVSRIAPELLHPGANEHEAQHDAREAERQFLRDQEFPQSELDALSRFEAVFGPLPVETPLQQRFAIYDEMLQDYRRQIGDETHPVLLFLQTILPWNNLRDMALQRALQERGIQDPVQAEHVERRARDERVWRVAQEEAQRREDAESSTDEEGWI